MPLHNGKIKEDLKIALFRDGWVVYSSLGENTIQVPKGQPFKTFQEASSYRKMLWNEKSGVPSA